MFLTDYLPPLRAALPSAVRAGLSGDGAPLARLVRESRRFEELGSPRDFSVARYATVCETTPLPWDPGTPIDQRPAVVQQRIAAAPAGAFAPFDPAAVVEDEINLCLRWPDVPRAPATAPEPPYPAVPTLILQGGEDLRTPPEWSAAVAARIPGAKRLVVPGVGHSTVSDPRGCAADAIVRFVARRFGAHAMLARAHRRAGGGRGPGGLRLAARLQRAPAQGRSDRAGARGDVRRPPDRAVAGRALCRRRRAARRFVGDQRRPARAGRLPGGQWRDRQRRRLAVADDCASSGTKAASGTVTLRS